MDSPLHVGIPRSQKYNLRSFYVLGQKDKINWKNTPRLAKLDKDIDAHM